MRYNWFDLWGFLVFQKNYPRGVGFKKENSLARLTRQAKENLNRSLFLDNSYQMSSKYGLLEEEKSPYNKLYDVRTSPYLDCITIDGLFRLDSKKILPYSYEMIMEAFKFIAFVTGLTVKFSHVRNDGDINLALIQPEGNLATRTLVFTDSNVESHLILNQTLHVNFEDEFNPSVDYKRTGVTDDNEALIAEIVAQITASLRKIYNENAIKSQLELVYMKNEHNLANIYDKREFNRIVESLVFVNFSFQKGFLHEKFGEFLIEQRDLYVKFEL